MKNKSLLAFVAVVALATIASPAFAQTAAYRHHHAHRPVSNNDRANSGYRANASIGRTGDPVNDPTMTGGGSMGYNSCAGHPAC